MNSNTVIKAINSTDTNAFLRWKAEDIISDYNDCVMFKIDDLEIKIRNESEIYTIEIIKDNSIVDKVENLYYDQVVTNVDKLLM